MYIFNSIQELSYKYRLKLFIQYHILVPKLESVLKKLHDPERYPVDEYEKIAAEYRSLWAEYERLEVKIQRAFHMYDIEKALDGFAIRSRGRKRSDQSS